MPDNVQYPLSGSSGTADVVQKTDDLSGAHVPYVKILDGANGGTDPIGGTTANGLDVDVTRVQGTVATGPTNGTPVTTTWDSSTAPGTQLDIPSTGYNAVVVQIADDGGGATAGSIAFLGSYDGGATVPVTLSGINVGSGPGGILIQTVDIPTMAGSPHNLLFLTNGLTNIYIFLSAAITGAAVISIYAVPTTVIADPVATRGILHTIAGLGEARPGSAIQVAGSDGSLLWPLKTDANGELQVHVLTVPADPFGVNADAAVAAGAAGSISAKLRRATQGLEDLKTGVVLAAGSNAIGKLASNSGVEIGNVGVVSVPADPFGSNADGIVAAGASGSISAKLKRVTQGLEDLKTSIVLDAGTAAIGKLAANSGVDIGDVDVTSLPNVTIGTMAALVAGTANIGDVDVLTLPALPAGTNNIGDVDVLTLPAIPAGNNNIGDVDAIQSGTWTVQPGNTPNTVPWLVTQVPVVGSGLTTYHLVSAGTTNATNIKASAGELFGWYIYNSNAAARKLAFHNSASAPTAGASVFFSIVIPPTSGANVFSDTGIAFSAGIGITTVTGLADNDSAAVAANDLIINLFYT